MADLPTGPGSNGYPRFQAQERLLKQLISQFRCAVCRRGFEREQVRVTARRDHVLVLSVRCGRCRNQHVFWATLPASRFQAKDDGEQSVLCDLTADEEEKFAEMAPVGADDVLDMHEFLRDFSGDFRGLFGPLTP